MAPPSWLSDIRRTYCESFLPEYAECRVKKRYKQFWLKIFASYLTMFPLIDEMYPNKSLGQLTQEEMEASWDGGTDHGTSLIQRLKEWFRWQFNPRSRNNTVSVSPKLLKDIYTPRTRGLKAYETFAKLYPEKVSAALDKRCEEDGIEKSKKVSRWHSVCKDLYSKATEEEIQAVEERIADDAEEEEESEEGEPETYHRFLTSLPSVLSAVVDPAVRKAGVLALVTVVGPEPASDGKIKVHTLQFGDKDKTPLFAGTWNEYERVFVTALTQFAKRHEFPPDVCAQRALNRDARPLPAEETSAEKSAISSQNSTSVTNSASSSTSKLGPTSTTSLAKTSDPPLPATATHPSRVPLVQPLSLELARSSAVAGPLADRPPESTVEGIHPPAPMLSTSASGTSQAAPSAAAAIAKLGTSEKVTIPESGTRVDGTQSLPLNTATSAISTGSHASNIPQSSNQGEGFHAPSLDSSTSAFPNSTHIPPQFEMFQSTFPNVYGRNFDFTASQGLRPFPDCMNDGSLNNTGLSWQNINMQQSEASIQIPRASYAAYASESDVLSKDVWGNKCANTWNGQTMFSAVAGDFLQHQTQDHGSANDSQSAPHGHLLPAVDRGSPDSDFDFGGLGDFDADLEAGHRLEAEQPPGSALDKALALWNARAKQQKLHDTSNPAHPSIKSQYVAGAASFVNPDIPGVGNGALHSATPFPTHVRNDLDSPPPIGGPNATNVNHSVKTFTNTIVKAGSQPNGGIAPPQTTYGQHLGTTSHNRHSQAVDPVASTPNPVALPPSVGSTPNPVASLPAVASTPNPVAPTPAIDPGSSTQNPSPNGGTAASPDASATAVVSTSSAGPKTVSPDALAVSSSATPAGDAEQDSEESAGRRRSGRAAKPSTTREKLQLIGSNVPQTSRPPPVNDGKDDGEPLWYVNTVNDLRAVDLGTQWSDVVEKWCTLELSLGYGKSLKVRHTGLFLVIPKLKVFG
ncbi:hypothetical protein D9611_000779 [Ephemerocybe angulata]|uniref:Uncharacterized protein n=1 Tax=Ephemerocybe angulata TaxID=980116 RepID=A0A8H5BQ24_9AGAR|nr:hypothetical protein D9611_000779 [Tulosesus angulatus]